MQREKKHYMEGNVYKIIVALAMAVLFVFPCTHVDAEVAQPYAHAEITVKIIPAMNNTFGYDILADGRTMIHQPSTPGLPGNEGFRTEKDAQKWRK